MDVEGTEVREAIQKISTGLNADSVEWCPYEDSQHLLLCGIYQLQEEPMNPQADSAVPQSTSPSEQTRNGGVLVFGLNFKEKCQPCLEKYNSINLCGVLDIKWPHKQFSDAATFGLVDAEGFCQLFAVSEIHSLKEITKAKLTDHSLGLSLGFSNPSDGNPPQVVASDSAGFITVLNIDEGLSPTASWQAHEYEAWITAFHLYDNNLVFSGGDDCRLKGWDIRNHSRPVFVSKRHQMGVCSIQSHPFLENVFASGSYDEEILVWDRRSMKTPLTSSTLGGGVWRIKWNPLTGDTILTATMYNGTHIIDFKNSKDGVMPIVATHSDHNLAYGADWCRLDATGERRQDLTQQDGTPYLIATCSFYDQSLHLWQWQDCIK